MTDKIIIVTPPDDVPLADGIRLLLVGLTPDQTKVVSDAFNQLTTKHTLIVYVAADNTDTGWLLDKKHKSHTIIFNSNHPNEMLVGYLAAQPNSYYFGILRELNQTNTNEIYNTDQLIEILEKDAIAHEKK